MDESTIKILKEAVECFDSGSASYGLVLLYDVIYEEGVDRRLIDNAIEAAENGECFRAANFINEMFM